MRIKRLGEAFCLVTFIFSLTMTISYSAEIVFKNQGSQIGTVMEEDEQTVTIRFYRKDIQSIDKIRKDVLSSEKNVGSKQSAPAQLETQEQIKRLEERIERLEKDQIEDHKTFGSPTIDPPDKLTTTKQLLKEEMGSVSGIILWNDRPLADRDVMIRLERYTGSSWGSLTKIFSGDPSKSAQNKEVILETRTDSQGNYIFRNAPPGQYRLYWMPDGKTGWVRRFREKHDFEVIPGELTIQNIPEKK